MTEPEPHERFIAFAHALERDDFAALERLLSAGCTWTADHGSLAGAQAIVAARRGDAERRQREFDELRRELRIEPIDDDRAALFVTEYLMKVPALWHRRHLRLDVEANAAGTIERVTETEAD
jgi:hypothetical protein